MVVKRLNDHLEKYYTLDDNQAAFRHARSMTDQIWKLNQALKDGFHRKMSTFAVFVDFNAVYDRVWGVGDSSPSSLIHSFRVLTEVDQKFLVSTLSMQI